VRKLVECNKSVNRPRKTGSLAGTAQTRGTSTCRHLGRLNPQFEKNK